MLTILVKAEGSSMLPAGKLRQLHHKLAKGQALGSVHLGGVLKALFIYIGPC